MPGGYGLDQGVAQFLGLFWFPVAVAAYVGGPAGGGGEQRPDPVRAGVADDHGPFLADADGHGGAAALGGGFVDDDVGAEGRVRGLLGHRGNAPVGWDWSSRMIHPWVWGRSGQLW